MIRVLSMATLILVACEEVGPKPFTEAVELGGQLTPADTLNRGRRVYQHYCQACHGPRGDGLGPLGIHQKPPARDLRLGIIKFAAVPAGSLPRDEDLARVLRLGLPGTAMLIWNVDDGQVDDVIQYIKTFAPRWRTGTAGKAIEITEDPWVDAGAAARRGREVYHGVAQCTGCHPSYTSLADQPSPALRDSAFGPLKPTELRGAQLRNGTAPGDLYRVIAAGVGGTSMPTWKGALPERDLWALVHYVRALRK